MLNQVQHCEGFIAITSAIIISVLLLAIVFTLSFSGFFARFNILDSEYKNRSDALAEACVEKVLLNIEQSISFTGDVVVDADTNPDTICQIKSVTSSGGNHTIYTKAEFPQTGSGRATTNLKVVVDSDDLSVVTWQELPACYPPNPPTSPCN